MNTPPFPLLEARENTVSSRSICTGRSGSRTKKNFLPPTASKDYRVRFLYFIIAVILYNVWRLANFVLRDEVTVHLGETPPLRAWEIVQLVSRFLFDPGG